jgi:4-hydroxybenzoate polyprenyltransferase
MSATLVPAAATIAARDEAPRRAAGRVRDLVRLIRPQHWVKNVFVLAPLLFSGLITDLAACKAGALAFACFCLWASAVYPLNDVFDARTDRRHPRKRHRPVAAGRVSPAAAVAVSLALAGAGLCLALNLSGPGLAVLGGAYLLNNVVYCLLLRYRVVVDVIAIGVGFVLRILAGCVAIGVEPSSWVLVCGFTLALLLGFGKRRAETQALQGPAEYRSTLVSYSAAKLDLLLGITASVCILAYILYTVSPETIQRHHTNHLIYTVPLVLYGIFRFLLKVQEGAGDGPVEILCKDPVFWATGALWAGAVVLILYCR